MKVRNKNHDGSPVIINGNNNAVTITNGFPPPDRPPRRGPSHEQMALIAFVLLVLLGICVPHLSPAIYALLVEAFKQFISHVL